MTPPTRAWTITAHPRRIKPVTLALIIGATTNLAALASLAAILLGWPLWVVVVGTIATAALATAGRQAIRAIPTPRPPTTVPAQDLSRAQDPSEDGD